MPETESRPRQGKAGHRDLQKVLTSRFRLGKSVDQYRNRCHEPSPLCLQERPSAFLGFSAFFRIVQRSKPADFTQYLAIHAEASCRRLPISEVVLKACKYPMGADEEALVALFHAVPVAGTGLGGRPANCSGRPWTSEERLDRVGRSSSRSLWNTCKMDDIADALRRLTEFASRSELTFRIASLESDLLGKTQESAEQVLSVERVDADLLRAALVVKTASSQIDVIVHTVGILVSLQYILDPTERIESLSLGAGNTGRAHDLETNQRVAEFKFIEWKGGAESIRQNGLFMDIFNLMSNATDRKKCVYVVGQEHPMRFLNGRRSIGSVLSKNAGTAERFEEAHGGRFSVVRDYWQSIRDEVELIDLRDVVPAFRLDGEGG